MMGDTAETVDQLRRIDGADELAQGVQDAPACQALRRGQSVVISPPSITKSLPVMFAARPLARKRTRSAISPG